jgi:hypothetical protein
MRRRRSHTKKSSPPRICGVRCEMPPNFTTMRQNLPIKSVHARNINRLFFVCLIVDGQNGKKKIKVVLLRVFNLNSFDEKQKIIHLS